MRSPATPPRRRHAVVTAVAALLGLLTAVGCGALGTDGDDNKRVDMDAISTQLETQLLEVPGVTRAEVVWQDNVTAPGSTAVNVSVKPETALEPVVDAAVRLVWHSKLNPLTSIRVGAVHDGNETSGTVRSIIVKDEQAELDKKYGPRPK